MRLFLFAQMRNVFRKKLLRMSSSWRRRSPNQKVQPTAQRRHSYEIRPRSDKRGVDLISDVLPFGALWYRGPNAISNAIDFAKFFSRSHDAVIRVYDEAGNVIETHEHIGDFKEP
jgi:hypothetical protein